MAKSKSERQTALDAIIREYLILKGTPYIEGNGAMGILYRRLLRPAADVLKASDGRTDVGIAKIREVKRWADSANLSWALETVIKRWFENNSPQPKTVFTKDDWKDDLPAEDRPRTREDQVRIDKGVESVRDIMASKGLLNGQRSGTSKGGK